MRNTYPGKLGKNGLSFPPLWCLVGWREEFEIIPILQLAGAI